MPFNSSNGGGGGPWGGGSGGSGGGNRGGGKSPWGSGNGGGSGGGGGGGQGGGGPDLEDLFRQGRDRLKVVLGGGGGRGGRGGGGRGPGGRFEKFLPVIVPAVLAVAWASMSFYTVKPEEKSVELFLGEFSEIGSPGLNFAPWPLVTHEVLPVTREEVVSIGYSTGTRRGDAGLMLTGDENIIDIDFQVVWNISDPAKYLFNLSDPEVTIRAVAESAMREVIGRSEMKPILNRDRGVIAQEVMDIVQTILDSYESGVNIVRVNFERADPPGDVIAAFKDVQAAEQDRATEENRAEAYRNEVLARARGEAAKIEQEAEGYRAKVVNEAKGEASRFTSILAEYQAAPEVTRQRLYLETIERVLGDVDKIIIDEKAGGGAGGSGVVPYLPLNELRRGSAGTNSGGTN